MMIINKQRDQSTRIDSFNNHVYDIEDAKLIPLVSMLVLSFHPNNNHVFP